MTLKKSFLASCRCYYCCFDSPKISIAFEYRKKYKNSSTVLASTKNSFRKKRVEREHLHPPERRGPSSYLLQILARTTPSNSRRPFD